MPETIVVNDEFFCKRLQNMPRRDLDTLLFLNQCHPFSETNEIYEAVGYGEKFLAAIADWLDEARGLGWLTADEAVQLSKRVRMWYARRFDVT